MEQALSGSWECLKVLLMRGHHAEAQALVESSARVLENTSPLSMVADLAGGGMAEGVVSAENVAQADWDMFLNILMTATPLPVVRGDTCL